MIKKPSNYDGTEVFNNFKKLKAGAYLCEIKQVEEKTSNYGKKYLEVMFDIADGEFKDFFKNKYINDKQENKKWTGIWKIFKETTDGNTNKFFKGFITSIEESNNFNFLWEDENNEESLKNKKIGIIMREEEFYGNDGKIKTAVQPYIAISINSIPNAKIPEIKKVQQSYDIPGVTADDYVDDLPF